MLPRARSLSVWPMSGFSSSAVAAASPSAAAGFWRYGAAAYAWSRRLRMTCLGESGFSVFQAGHCDWQRPHSVQVVKSRMPFQEKSWIEMFVFRYDRPWPTGEPWLVDTTDGFLGLGVASAAAVLLYAVHRLRVLAVMNAKGAYGIVRKACWTPLATLFIASTDGPSGLAVMRSHLLMTKTQGLYCLAM